MSSCVGGGGQEVVPADRAAQLRDVRLGVEVGDDDGVLDRGHLGKQAGDDLAAIEVAAVVAVAVDAEEHLRLDLREPVDDRAGAEVGRAARPDRADRCGGEEGDHRLGQVRDVGDDPVAAPDSALAQSGGRAGDVLAELAPGHRAELAQLGRVLDREPVAGLAREQILGVVELGAGEPARAGHVAAGEDALVGRRGADAEVVPDRRPEVFELVDRPAPQGFVVIAEAEAPVGFEPAHVGGQVGALDHLGGGRPEQLAGRRFDHPETSISGRASARPRSASSRRTSSSANPCARSRASGSTCSGVSVGWWRLATMPLASRQVIPIARMRASRGGHRVAGPAVGERRGAVGALALGVGLGDRPAELDQPAVHRVADEPAGAGLEADVAAADRVDREEEGGAAVELAPVAAHERAHPLLLALLAAVEHDPDIEVARRVGGELAGERDRGGDARGVVVGAGDDVGDLDLDQGEDAQEEDEGGEELEHRDSVRVEPRHPRAEQRQEQRQRPEEDPEGAERHRRALCDPRPAAGAPRGEDRAAARGVDVGADQQPAPAPGSGRGRRRSGRRGGRRAGERGRRGS